MGPGLLGQEGGRCESPKGGVGPDSVVVDLPVLQQVLGVAHGREAVLVQELVAHARVEALCVGVLDRLARSDGVMLDATLSSPLVEGPTRELRAVVGSDPRRGAVGLDRSVEDAKHPLRRQRDVALERCAELRVIVDDREDP